MARPTTDDPLLPLSARLPGDIVERLRREAKEQGVTLSDVLRSYLSLAEAKPLGKPVPRRRPKKLGVVSGVDPALLRQLASIGNNLNQLARATNADLLAGTPVESTQILVNLLAIEQEITRIGGHFAR